jgi:hypothetical protein
MVVAMSSLVLGFFFVAIQALPFFLILSVNYVSNITYGILKKRIEK